MGAEFFVICDHDGCNSRVQTPQPGNLPPSWVVINYGAANIKSGQMEQRQKVFCGWRCANKFTKSNLTKEDVDG